MPTYNLIYTDRTDGSIIDVAVPNLTEGDLNGWRWRGRDQTHAYIVDSYHYAVLGGAAGIDLDIMNLSTGYRVAVLGDAKIEDLKDTTDLREKLVRCLQRMIDHDARTGPFPKRHTTRKTPIVCRECGHTFHRTIAPGTYEIRCPKCQSYDTDVA